MNIFDFITDILFKKRGNLLDNIDDEAAYNPYMICRWISMYSPQSAVLINHTCNKYYSIFESKKDHYTFLSSIIPRGKPARLNYIKKIQKESDKDTTQIVDIMATNLEISKREINYYVKTHNIDLDKYKI
tara:strand:+ start:375 stop:764 length:390 start_codon:yes stop_codon:yes gene_type:complete